MCGHRSPVGPRPDRRVRSFGVVAAAVVAVVAPVAGCGSERAPGAGAQPVKLDELPQATTFTTLRGLPQDPEMALAGDGDGTVVHPTEPVPVSARPGAPAVAVLPDEQLDGPTWVPVVESANGWHRVMLPSRPNRTTGWIRDSPDALTTARSPYVVKVETGARRLTVVKSGRTLRTWKVAVGAPKTPTPLGNTFMLALLKPSRPTVSPLIMPVGSHSETLDTFGGGPGTVAFHGWSDASVFGKAVTHGCVRVPAPALAHLSRIPLGTPVIVTA
ncbi:L,D-transpeptidase [Thermomonospora umbrina]|uniref:L,D-transpeptidase n=1 Tax=Thermomonospora umbrina TaxID=111806 RepID=UPI000E21F07F|nr:L,D-transpeptidase [Thermomonospora umbrina]